MILKFFRAMRDFCKALEWPESHDPFDFHYGVALHDIRQREEAEKVAADPRRPMFAQLDEPEA